MGAIRTFAQRLRYGRRGPNHPNAKKTHCKYGHEYNAENTQVYQRKYKTGWGVQRVCKKCNGARALERYYKNRGGDYVT
jgi:hypothetical protein